jgi:predicted nucleic acid-binding protein
MARVEPSPTFGSSRPRRRRRITSERRCSMPAAPGCPPEAQRLPARCLRTRVSGGFADRVAGVIVLDASTLIAVLDPDDAHHQAAEELVASAVSDELGVNQLTLAEVLVGPVRSDRLGHTLDGLRQLEVMQLGFPADSPIRLAVLRSQTGLTMPDCCVLLSAQDQGGAVASFDEHLRPGALNQGLDVLP